MKFSIFLFPLKGDCVDSDKLCDGNSDCTDRSDEDVKYCAAVHCPSYAFRCGYGACINGKKKCDGTIDCFDGNKIFEITF